MDFITTVTGEKLSFAPKIAKLSDPITESEKKIAREKYKKRLEEFNNLDRNKYEFNCVDRSRFLSLPYSFDLDSCLRVNKEKQRRKEYLEEMKKIHDDNMQMKYYDYILTLREEMHLVEDEDDMFYDGYLADNYSSSEDEEY